MSSAGSFENTRDLLCGLLGAKNAGVTTRRDRKACVEAKQVAVAEHPSDGESLKTSKTALEGLVSLVVRKGYFRLLVASI
jgi:hypothetical protein